MEKLNANAKATDSQIDCLLKAMIIMTRQNKLVITVRAFFSEKYFFILIGSLRDSRSTNIIQGWVSTIVALDQQGYFFDKKMLRIYLCRTELEIDEGYHNCKPPK